MPIMGPTVAVTKIPDIRDDTLATYGFIQESIITASSSIYMMLFCNKRNAKPYKSVKYHIIIKKTMQNKSGMCLKIFAKLTIPICKISYCNKKINVEKKTERDINDTAAIFLQSRPRVSKKK